MESLAIIENKDGILVVSSRVIAKNMNKEHRRVMQDVKEKSLHEFVQWIIPSKYKADNGQEYDEYLFTKDGFTLLMMNYTGYNDFKVAYIKKFNEMEKALLNPLNMLLALSKEQLAMNNIQLAQMIQEKDEVIEKQETKLKEQIPLVFFADTIIKSKECITMNDMAKLLNDENISIGRNKLFEKLRSKKILMSGNAPYQKYIDNGWFKTTETVKRTPYGDKLYMVTLVTPRGQVGIVEMMRGEA